MKLFLKHRKGGYEHIQSETLYWQHHGTDGNEVLCFGLFQRDLISRLRDLASRENGFEKLTTICVRIVNGDISKSNGNGKYAV